MASNLKNQDSNKEEKKVDTKYYDELFKKIKDQDSNEFNDPESIDILYNNILEQISESEKELKKCLNSFHIDFFIHKSNLENFVRLFELLTIDSDKINDYLSDIRISRAYEACLAMVGGKVLAQQKISSTNEEIFEKLKVCLNNFGKYLVENFQTIIETQNGVFALRFFLKIIGNEDVLEQHSTAVSNTNKSNKKYQNKMNEFNIKNVEIKIVPTEWKLSKFLKKLSKKLDDLNLLEIGLIPSVSPSISLLLRKLSTTYPDISSNVIDAIHKQFVKKSNSFHTMIQDSIGSRFIESFLYSCPIDLLVDYYLNEHITPNIVSYSKHIYANYPIQTLVKHRLKSEPKLKVLFESLVNNLESILDLHTDLSYKHYLIIELIESSQKSSHLNLDDLVDKLVSFFGCDSDDNRVNFLRALLIYEKLEDIEKETSIDQALFTSDLKPIGSTIASKLIESDNKIVSKSFNSFNSNEIECLSTSNVGSHFVQECLKMMNIKDRSVMLQSFLDKMKSRFLILCINRSGSFVIETVWSVSTLKQRLAILEELKGSENQLKNDIYGRFFVNKVGLGFYKRNAEEWKKIQNNEFKKRKMLNELIDSSNDKKKFKK